MRSMDEEQRKNQFNISGEKKLISHIFVTSSLIWFSYAPIKCNKESS